MKSIKRPYIVIFTVFTLTLLMSFNVYFFVSNKNSQTARTDQYAKSADSVTYLLSIERNSAFSSMMDNDKPLNKELTFSNDSNNNITLTDFLKRFIKRPKLVLRYTEINCTPCVDSSVLTLKEVTNKVGEENILILASYHSKRDMLIWKRVNNIKYPIYQIPDNKTGLNVDAENVPYFFILLPESNTVHHLFLPLKENMKRTREYLTGMAERYY